MIAILGHLDVDPNARDAILAATAELQLSTRAEEPGCLEYTIGADPADPGRILIAELWDSEASLDAHFVHPNFVRMGEIFSNAPRTGGSAMKYEISRSATVRDGDGKPSATYWSTEKG